MNIEPIHNKSDYIAACKQVSALVDLDPPDTLVRDVICQPQNGADLLCEAEIELKQLRAGHKLSSSDLDKILAD